MSGAFISTDGLFVHLAQTPAPSGGGFGQMLMGMLPFVLMFIGFYFLLIAPQRRKQKEHARMLDTLKAGDEVLTMGGIYGTITNVKKDRFQLKIGDDTRVDIAKNAVQARIPAETTPARK